MCYNENVKVNIDSCGRGWTDKKTADGLLTEDKDGVKLFYEIDGDECTLTYKNGKAVQKRQGEQFVEIAFEQGQRTSCTVGSGGLSGSYEVFTNKLNFVSGKGGFKLSLEYTSGTDRELIKLTLTAVKISRGIK